MFGKRGHIGKWPIVWHGQLLRWVWLILLLRPPRQKPSVLEHQQHLGWPTNLLTRQSPSLFFPIVRLDLDVADRAPIIAETIPFVLPLVSALGAFVGLAIQRHGRVPWVHIDRPLKPNRRTRRRRHQAGQGRPTGSLPCYPTSKCLR